MEVGEIFFFTATINNWNHLLQQNSYKEVIIQSLDYLSRTNKLDVFAFVIMPNHIHLIWRTNEMNGKETVQGSFLKYTAHTFKEKLKKEDSALLSAYAVDAKNKKYEFWQRDSLAVHLYTSEVAYQKLEYIHLNPLAEHWQLVTDPYDYYYSSASYYQKNSSVFPFLKDLRQEF
jgi:REP element-mobilizing transposase RayT